MSRGFWTICLLAFWAAPVHAQMTIVIDDFGDRNGEDLDLDNADPVSGSECDADADLVLDIDMIDSTAVVLDFWEGSGADCSTTDNRSGDDPACEVIHTENTNGQTSIQNLTIDIQELIDDCDEDKLYEIWVLAVSASGSEAEVDAGDAALLGILLEGGDVNAPSGVSATNGESSIAVSWTVPTGIDHQEIYVDTSPGTSCVDSPLQDDATITDPLPANVRLVDSDVTATTDSTSISVSDLGVSTGDYVQVAVVAIDTANNRSTMNTDCAQVVNTRGFCDELGVPGDSGTSTGCPNECSVGTFGGFEDHAFTWAIAFSTVALLARRRRR